MKKLIITILALATIALADKPICTVSLEKEEAVIFSCEGDTIVSSTLIIAKDLDFISHNGKYSDGSTFSDMHTREGKYARHQLSTVTDRYGITSVIMDMTFGSWSSGLYSYKMENFYEWYRKHYDFN